MTRLVGVSSLLLLLLTALPAVSDDHQKAQKLLSKVTAMATDPAGRRAVSLAVSDMLAVGRPELARRRHVMNINYGEIFVAYYLAKDGLNFDEIAAQMKTGKTFFQIANEQRANWKQIATDAKKLNGRIDENLLRHFSNPKAETERNLSDGYDPFLDSVRADGNVSQEEISDAQNRYVFLRDHAGAVMGGSLDTVSEGAARNARPDPIRSENTRPGPN